MSVAALAAAVALSFFVSLALETRPPSIAALRAPWRATLIRAALHLALFAAAFSLSWRPWHAAFVTCVIAFLFGAGSAMKQRIIGEPVVFSDFALVRLAIRHPRLYYAEKLAEPKALATFAAVAAATAIWFAIEPSILPSGAWPLLLAPPVVVGAAVLALRSRTASRTARELVADRPDLESAIARFGLGGAMILHWLAWRGRERPGSAARRAMAAAPVAGAGGPALVVAIQCESFLDLAARGAEGPGLPAYRALCREAVAWGRCHTPAAEGAYTMRSEFGFLTGLPTDALGLDTFDPYLTAVDYAEASIARRLKAAGRKTVFIHPYDRRFFARDEFVPRLGFDRFVDGDAFAGAERYGPYVADAAVADALIVEIESADAPTFLFAVTIENHGPWGPGRLVGVDDPAEQYALHLENADRMIGRIADALRRRPGGAVMCVYGDHAPARTIHPTLQNRKSTDYVVWDTRNLLGSPSARRDLDVDAVGRLTLERAATP